MFVPRQDSMPRQDSRAQESQRFVHQRNSSVSASWVHSWMRPSFGKCSPVSDENLTRFWEREIVVQKGKARVCQNRRSTIPSRIWIHLTFLCVWWCPCAYTSRHKNKRLQKVRRISPTNTECKNSQAWMSRSTGQIENNVLKRTYLSFNEILSSCRRVFFGRKENDCLCTRFMTFCQVCWCWSILRTLSCHGMMYFCLTKRTHNHCVTFIRIYTTFNCNSCVQEWTLWSQRSLISLHNNCVLHCQCHEACLL